MHAKKLALAAAGALMTTPAVPAKAAPTIRKPLAGHISAASHMRAAARELARERRAQRTAARRRAARRREAGFARVAIPPVLHSIAACESGGNPRAVGGGGAFRGKYQFTYETWAAVGGTGDPAAASEAEQDMRAALLYQRAGSSPWPVCG